MSKYFHLSASAEQLIAVSRAAAKDKNLSLKARGALLYMLALEPGESISVSDLGEALGVSPRSLNPLLRELREGGYLVRESRRDPNTGRMAGDFYSVGSIPTEDPIDEQNKRAHKWAPFYSAVSADLTGEPNGWLKDDGGAYSWARRLAAQIGKLAGDDIEASIQAWRLFVSDHTEQEFFRFVTTRNARERFGIWYSRRGKKVIAAPPTPSFDIADKWAGTVQASPEKQSPDLPAVTDLDALW